MERGVADSSGGHTVGARTEPSCPHTTRDSQQVGELPTPWEVLEETLMVGVYGQKRRSEQARMDLPHQGTVQAFPRTHKKKPQVSHTGPRRNPIPSTATQVAMTEKQ